MADHATKNPIKLRYWKGRYGLLPAAMVAAYGMLYLVFHLWIGVWHWVFDSTNGLGSRPPDYYGERPAKSSFNAAVGHEIAASWIRVALCLALAAVMAGLVLGIRRYHRSIAAKREARRQTLEGATLRLARADAQDRLHELTYLAPKGTHGRKAKQFDLFFIANGDVRAICLKWDQISWEKLVIGVANVRFPTATVNNIGVTVYGHQAVVYTSSNVYGLAPAD